LGFEIKENEDTANVFLEKDGTLFLLYRRTDFEKMANRSFEYTNAINGHYEIALSVENHAAVDSAFQEIVSKGATPILEPTTEPWGQRTCYIADPENNLVEIDSFNPQNPVYHDVSLRHCPPSYRSMFSVQVSFEKIIYSIRNK
jgi:predicted lactoylglutathione lyase